MVDYSQPYNSQDYDPPAPVLDIVIGKGGNGQTVALTALVDSGADATMLPINVLQQVGARYLQTQQMRGVIGQIKVVDTYLVTITIGGETIFGIEAIAMQTGSEAIIGRDVLNQLIITLNGLAYSTEVSF